MSWLRPASRRSAGSFSPLFVGAGVAMYAPRIAFLLGGCFSPLFVGAGVAISAVRGSCCYGWMFQSPICRGRRCNAVMTSPQISSICVSVPYLSGQALQWNELTDAGKALLFQSPICRGRRCNLRRCVSFSSCLCRFSPLLVGAGVAMRAARKLHQRAPYRFSPLLVGAGVAIGGARADVQVHGRVSVPYLSGQALQYELLLMPAISANWFQSPICRGRRCNSWFSDGVRSVSGFSPLFVGAGVAIKFNTLPQFC